MTPYYADESVTLYCGDCRDVLPTLADTPVACVFFDPPYGLGVAAWDRAIDCLDIVPALKSGLREGGSMYATCSPHILSTMLVAVEPDRVIAWCKPNLPLRKGLNDWEWSVEFVLRYVKGDAPTPFYKPRGEDGRDFWRIPVENGFLNREGMNHPARKPIRLLKRIISACTDGDDIVLDPTCGSGTSLAAAKQLGRKSIGIERDEKTCELAVTRLRQGTLAEMFQ